jgi:hypothetical protein
MATVRTWKGEQNIAVPPDQVNFWARLSSDKPQAMECGTTAQCEQVASGVSFFRAQSDENVQRSIYEPIKSQLCSPPPFGVNYAGNPDPIDLTSSYVVVVDPKTFSGSFLTTETLDACTVIAAWDADNNDLLLYHQEPLKPPQNGVTAWLGDESLSGWITNLCKSDVSGPYYGDSDIGKKLIEAHLLRRVTLHGQRPFLSIGPSGKHVGIGDSIRRDV